MDFEYFSWGSNLIGVLVFTYLFFSSLGSNCYSLFDTTLSLSALFLAVITQFISIVWKGEND